MNGGPPKVSVLLASRNGERHLDAALDSLAAQTFGDFEVVAVNDGSSDGTGTLLERRASAWPALRVLRTEGIGLAGALARAATTARGALLARQDDDDLSQPERLERQVAFLDRHAGIGIVGSAATVIDERGATIGEERLPLEDRALRRMLRRAPPFVHGSVMMRREAYERAGGYRTAFQASQDYDLWLRLPADAGLANLDEPLYAWRRHSGGVFARARRAQVFFLAVARAFAEERRATGKDSIALLDACRDPEELLDVYPRADRLAFYFGEALVREGRVAEARTFLQRAFATPRSFPAALGWWALSFPVALTPRATRARAATAAMP